MKIALLNDQLNAGGAEKVLVNMANLLHSKGIDVIVVLFMSASSLDKQLHPGIPVHYLSRKGRFDRRAMFTLKLLVQSCDIVHVHSRYNLRYFMVAKYLTGIHHPKLVFHEHVPDYTRLDLFTRKLFTRLDGYIAVLQNICDWVIGQKTIEAHKVFYLPNIVAPPVKAIEFIQNTNHKILMIGNFRRVKNHLFAIQLVEQLGNGITLDLYGMIEDAAYYNELVDYIQSNHLSTTVKIVSGVNNVYDVMGKYDLAIHTASNETGPLVLLEYMQAGLPFVTYNTGDVATHISNSLPEVVVQSFEMEQWITTINNMLLNKQVRESIKIKMKQVVEEIYTEEKYWERLLNVYKKVLQQT